MAHLFAVALQTPVIQNRAGIHFSLFILGDADFDTPLASIAMSEKVNIPQYVSGSLDLNSISVVSFTGCDEAIFRQLSQCETPVPLLSVLQLWAIRNMIDMNTFPNHREFARHFSLSPNSVKKLFEDFYEKKFKPLDETAVFIADCVLAYVKMLTQVKVV